MNATISSTDHVSVDVEPRDHSSPFTRASIVRSPRSSSSSVVIHGPSAVAKSLPFAGPNPLVISRAWTSRALKSFMIVTPKTWASASSGRRSEPGRADHERELQLVIHERGVGGPGDLGVGTDDRHGVHLVVGGRLVEVVGHLALAAGVGVHQMLLERGGVDHHGRVDGPRPLDVAERDRRPRSSPPRSRDRPPRGTPRRRRARRSCSAGRPRARAGSRRPSVGARRDESRRSAVARSTTRSASGSTATRRGSGPSAPARRILPSFIRPPSLATSSSLHRPDREPARAPRARGTRARARSCPRPAP